MKTTYLELLKKIDTSIFQNYKIVDDEEIDIDESELENCINNSIPVKIEIGPLDTFRKSVAEFWSK